MNLPRAWVSQPSHETYYRTVLLAPTTGHPRGMPRFVSSFCAAFSRGLGTKILVFNGRLGRIPLRFQDLCRHGAAEGEGVDRIAAG